MSTQSRRLKGGAECFLWDEGRISGRRREAEAEAGTGRYDGGRWRVLLLDLKGILYTKNPIPKKRATVSLSPSLLLPVYLCFAGVICARARRWVAPPLSQRGQACEPAPDRRKNIEEEGKESANPRPHGIFTSARGLFGSAPGKHGSVRGLPQACRSSIVSLLGDFWGRILRQFSPFERWLWLQLGQLHEV